MKINGIKMKMTQIWKDDEVIPVTPVKYEFKAQEGEELPIKIGDKIKVAGHSKGRGFQGVVKRHGFHGGPKTHGQKNRLRAPGSIGSTAPQRVLPGRRMGGRMGNNRVSVKNLQVIEIKTIENILMLKGALPGHIGSKVEINIKNPK
ncbi:MAG: 50S ribosomal protein L3 [Candidatus Liptonbacteria bacterium]|nr:50S ribosomal protein L3 [Candidatus Liptonbacteria bacterium]